MSSGNEIVQIVSYNAFLDKIQRFIVSYPPIEIGGAELQFKGLIILPPRDSSGTSTYPTEMILKESTYEGLIIAKCEFRGMTYDISLTSLPIMIGSKLCNTKRPDFSPYEIGEDPTDAGGYFIIKGVRKVIVMPERGAPGLSIFLGKSKFSTGERKKMKLYTELRPTKLVLGIYETKELVIFQGKSDNPVSIITLFEKYGWTVEQLRDYFGEAVEPSLAYEGLRVFEEELELIPDEEVVILMVQRLLRGEMTDRDHLRNKRISTTGSLLFRQFKHSFTKAMEKMVIISTKLPTKGILSWYPHGDIKNQIMNALTADMWTDIKTPGISQTFDEFYCQLGRLKGISRVATPLNERAKIDAPRKLHPSQYGFYCFYDTPEGARTGLMHCLTMNCKISTGIDTEVVIDIIDRLEIPIDLEDTISKPLFVDGKFYKELKNIKQFKNTIKQMRIRKEIAPYISISEREDSVEIWCDEGRVYRPVRVVKGGVITDEIDYLDSAECDDEDTIVVPTEDYIGSPSLATAIELDSSRSLLGYAASSIPFSNHNQSPRNVLGSLMIVQGIGIPVLNFKHHRGKILLMETPQYPIISTKVRETLTKDSAMNYSDVEIPNVQNIILCIAPYSGLNQEDSFVMSKSFVERGGMRIMKRLTYSLSLIGDDEFGYNSELKIRGNPGKLTPAGVIPQGTKISFGDVLICKTNGVNIVYDEKHPASVDIVELVTDGKGYKKFAVTIVQIRIPVIGDKFVISAHGQKGTVGAIVPDIDLPFSAETGIIPDFLMNPLAFPGRMTIALAIEHILGKEYAMGLRDKVDGSAYSTLPDDLRFDLIKEEMIDGISGEYIETELAIGPIAAMRLKHLAEDKVHARSRGSSDLLTRQPKEGKGKGLMSTLGGGIRVGVLERDCIGVHGASAVLLDRLYEQSDPFTITVCRDCGLKSTEICELCHGKGVDVTIPYATKLLIEEMMGVGIALRIKI